MAKEISMRKGVSRTRGDEGSIVVPLISAPYQTTERAKSPANIVYKKLKQMIKERTPEPQSNSSNTQQSNTQFNSATLTSNSGLSTGNGINNGVSTNLTSPATSWSNLWFSKKNDSDNKSKKHTSSSTTPGPVPHTDDVRLFGVDLTLCSNWVIFSILFSVVMLGFLLIGFVEEGFKFAFPDFSFGWFMTAIELIIFSIFAMLERLSKITSNTIAANANNNPPPISTTSSNSSSTSNSPSVKEINNNDSSISQINYNRLQSSAPSNDINNNNINNSSSNSNCSEELTNTNKDNTGTNNNNNNNNEDPKIIVITDLLDDEKKIDKKYTRKSIYDQIFERNVELKYHILVAVAMTISRGLTNISLLLLNYPTQVIFKSMKLISVMIGSRLFLHKRYSMFEYVAAPLMVAAAIAFSVGDAMDQLQFDFWGLVAVNVSLIFDSIHANSQEYIVRMHRDATMEMLVYSNFFSAILSCIVGICVGELYPILEFFQETSFTNVFIWFLVRALCLYVGVSALVVFTKKFGAVASVTVTTVRKILTVLLSYIIWPNTKVFASPHVYGTIFFVISLILNGAGVQNKASN